MTAPARALLDTSVFIAAESGRPLRIAALPAESAISVVTLAELSAGVLAAIDTGTRARRLGTLDSVRDMELLVVDEAVAAEWARLRVLVAEAGRRVNVNDLWIAATAAAWQLPVVTQDADFDVLAELFNFPVVRV